MSTPATVRPFLLVAATAAGYVILGKLAHACFALDTVAGVFWPAAGWALALVLRYGHAPIWGACIGGFVLTALAGRPLLACLAAAAAAGLSAWMGYFLIARDGSFNSRLPSFRDYARLLLRGAIPGSLLSALVGVSGMTLAGVMPATAFATNLAYWCGGDALGVILLTPALLFWLAQPTAGLIRWRTLEAALYLGLILALGQLIFLDHYPEFLPELPRRGFWIFFVLVWVAVRMGRRDVALLLFLSCVQAMVGLHNHVGFFVHANDSPGAALLHNWAHQAVQSIAITMFAIYLEERKWIENDLRIAAIAFECQEGIIIVDTDLRILRTNRSFTRITGYTAQEVLGQTTSFMRSDRHPPEFYENAWRTVRERGTWADEVWHRRKNGEIFPQWLTATAVANAQGVITHFVVTHTDLTELKKKEVEQQARQTAQRDALVREVHHRIKNGLQGITGVLRQFARTYPQTESVMSHAITLVKGIAVLHGLQGRASTGLPEVVHLEDLLHSLAADIRSVWKTPVTLDLAPELSFKIVPDETVPISLVLSELIVNAIKHGGAENGHVGISLSVGMTRGSACITISNEGALPAQASAAESGGLMLIESMMPRTGARLSMEQLGDHVITRLELTSPVVTWLLP